MDLKTNALKGKFVENGLTQQQVADNLGINVATLSRKLNGQQEFSRLECAKLKKLLNLDENAFVSIFFGN